MSIHIKDYGTKVTKGMFKPSVKHCDCAICCSIVAHMCKHMIATIFDLCCCNIFMHAYNEGNEEVHQSLWP